MEQVTVGELEACKKEFGNYVKEYEEKVVVYEDCIRVSPAKIMQYKADMELLNKMIAGECGMKRNVP